MDKSAEQRLEQVEKRIERFEQSVKKLGKDIHHSFKAIRDGYYDAALTNAGSILEALLQDIWRKEGIPGRAEKRTIDQLFSSIRNKVKIDRLAEDYIRDIQIVRNRAAHGQIVLAEDCIEALRKLSVVLEWYFREYVNVEEIATKDVEEKDTSEVRTPIKKRKIQPIFKNLISPILFRGKKHPGQYTKFKKFKLISLRILTFLLIIYLIISIIGFTNDIIYKAKLDKIKVEYDTYYRNQFPMDRTWLPSEWQLKNCNVVNTYLTLFPPKMDENWNTIPDEEYFKDEYRRRLSEDFDWDHFNKFYKQYEYSNASELEKELLDFEKYFKLGMLEDAVKCINLNPLYLIENDMFLNLSFFGKYIGFIVLKARLYFLQGNYEEGFKLIMFSLLLTIDINKISHSVMETILVAAHNKKIFKEMVPVLLSADLNKNQNFLNNIETFISNIVKELDTKNSCYKEYLWFGKISQLLIRELSINKLIYFSLGKTKYWKHGFSVFRMAYKDVKFLLVLLNSLKYIRGNREKSIFIYDYFVQNEASLSQVLTAGWNSIPFKINITKMLGKVILIISAYRKYGLDSKEFLELKGSDIFVNEFSGNNFEIIFENNVPYIQLDENNKLSLELIDYEKQHKEILKLLHNFDPESFDQIRSMFYSLELR